MSTDELHGQRIQLDYDLVVTKNAYESITMYKYYSYLGLAFGSNYEVM